MSSIVYDAVVVGAGPAGAMFAWEAAKQGLQVLLLERDKEPGIPVRCAEGILLRNLSGIITIPDYLVAQTINGMEMISPSNERLIITKTGKGYILHRRLFDAYLCEQACLAGAHMQVNANVTGLSFLNEQTTEVHYSHMGTKTTVKTRIVIGADGVESRVGRWAGIQTTVSLDDIDSCAQYLMTDLSIPESRCLLYFGSKVAPGGYAWVFPKSATTANVGLGISPKQSPNKSAKAWLDDFIHLHYPQAKQLAFTCGGVPTAKTLPTLVSNRVLLIGDAARQANPATGGGIDTALLAATVAAEVVIKSVQSNSINDHELKQYEDKWKVAWGKQQDIAYIIKEKFLQVKDSTYDRLFEDWKKIPSEDLTPKAIILSAIKHNPLLAAKISGSFFMHFIQGK